MEHTVLFRDYGKSLNLNIVPFILFYAPLYSTVLGTLFLCVCGMCVGAKSLQLCPTLCSPMDCSPPGTSVHGILQARILVWVAMPSSRRSSRPKVKSTSLMSPALAGGFYTTSATWKAQCVM